MPVHGFYDCVAGEVLDARHVCSGYFEHLSWLTDRIPAIGAIFSIGDLAMFLGISIMAVSFFFLVYTLIAERL